MKFFALLVFPALLAGCGPSTGDPNAYIRSVMEQTPRLADGPFEYKITRLPMEYFLAKELAQADSGAKPDLQSLKRTIKDRYAGGRYFLLRIGLDSSVALDPLFQTELLDKMRLLQMQQETARTEITGIAEKERNVHPDLILVNSDWITKQGVSVLFAFKEGDAKGLDRIEFGKSFVRSRNLSVDAKGLEPRLRFKG